MTSACKPAHQTTGVDLAMALVFLALGLNFLLLLDPSDTNFGLGFRVGFAPILLLCFAYISVFRIDFSDRLVSGLDIGVFLLILISIIGGLWFQWQNSISFGETFGRWGLLALTYFLAKGIFRAKPRADLFIELFQKYVFWAGMVMFSLLVLWRLQVFEGVNQANQNLFHEEIFILAALPFLPSFGQISRMVLAIIAVFAGLLTFKISGFLIALLVIFGVILQTCKTWRWQSNVAGFFLAVAALILVVSLAIITIGDQLPDGNVATRSVTYAFRLQQFMASPIVGNFFQMPSEIDVGWGDIVSHSDFLDLLAGLGIVGAMLFTIPIFALLIKPATQQMDSLFVKLLILGFLIVAAINPVLMNPNTAFLFWLSVGYLSALNSRKVNKTNG